MYNKFEELETNLLALKEAYHNYVMAYNNEDVVTIEKNLKKIVKIVSDLINKTILDWTVDYENTPIGNKLKELDRQIEEMGFIITSVFPTLSLPRENNFLKVQRILEEFLKLVNKYVTIINFHE